MRHAFFTMVLFALAFASYGETITCVGNNNNYDFFRYGYYVGTSGTNCNIWSDGLAPTPDKDYVIAKNVPNTPNFAAAADGSYTNFVFAGKSLELKGSATIGIYTYAPSSIEFPEANGGLKWTKGTIRFRDTGSRTAIVKGLLAVESTEVHKFLSTTKDGPAENPTANRNGIIVDAKLTGASNVSVSLSAYAYLNKGVYYPGYFWLRLAGDCSEYYGTVNLTGTNWLQLACASLPATVNVMGPGEIHSLYDGTTYVKTITDQNAYLTDFMIAPTNSLVVTNLTLKGGTLRFPAGVSGSGCLTVVESLTVSDEPQLLVENLPADPRASLDVLKVPTSFNPIDQLGIAWTPSETLGYVVVTNDDWQILRAYNPQASLSVAADESVTLTDLVVATLDVTNAYDETTKSAGCLTLDGTPVVTGGVTVHVPTFSTPSTGDDILVDQPRCAILKIKAGTLDTSKVTLDMTATTYDGGTEAGALPRSYSEWKTEDGYDVLYIGYWPVVRRTRLNEGGEYNDKGKFVPVSPSSGSITNKILWTDQQEPHAGADYLLPYRSSASATEPGPLSMSVASNLADGQGVYTFPGESLSLGCFVTLGSGLGEFHVRGPLWLLRTASQGALGGVVFSMGPAGTDGECRQKLTAEQIAIRATNSSYLWNCYGYWTGFRGVSGSVGVIDAEIEGGTNATLSLQCASATTAKAPAVLELTRENANFLGRVAIHNYGNSYKPSANQLTYVRFASPLALGAARTEFTTNALMLADWGYLAPTAAMTLDTANRGVFVLYHGGITNDLAFTLGARVTYAGEFEKTGAGVLTFACDERPMTGEETWPDPDLTKFPYKKAREQAPQIRISSGAVRTTTTNAVDGIPVVFAGGGIRVNPNAEVGSAEATYGFFNVACADALTTAEVGAKIPVSFDVTGLSEGDELSGAICTVRADSTLTTESFSFERPWPSAYRMSVTCETDTVAGTKTFRARAVKTGAFLFFR